MTADSSSRKLTTLSIRNRKQSGEKIAALTAYDYITAKLLDESGIDIVLVGDSVSNVFQGNETTLPVSVDEMIYHTRAVQNGIRRALLITDMPFLSYQVTVEDAVRNCGRIMKETRADGVKLEGGSAIIEVVKRVTEIGIPVMGHLGLTPQSINVFGTYKVRGTEPEEGQKILDDAKRLEDAGVFSLVLEKIPATLAQKVTDSVSVPTIGIGAGRHCDGQILVINDMLGLNENFRPRFVRRYAELAQAIREYVRHYVNDVHTRNFPGDEESY
jgi:3-methyl-2-oxobutanoate hydroxymethyltransferase